MLKKRFPFVDATLKGIGQIMLQESSLTGLLFLTGLFIGNWRYGLAALLATLVATFTAMVLKFRDQDIRAGIYGFNAALVGVALIFIFKGIWLTWLLIVLFGGIATPLFHHLFIRRNIPVYTFPFILITWIIYALLTNYSFYPLSDLAGIPDRGMNGIEAGLSTLYGGFGQVIFQRPLGIGILFFLAVLLPNPIAAFYGICASALGAISAGLLGFPQELIIIGIFGFNAVLTAIVFSGKGKMDAVWVLLGVSITILLHLLLAKTNILEPFGGIFTFAFVAGTWITLLIKKKVLKA